MLSRNLKIAQYKWRSKSQMIFMLKGKALRRGKGNGIALKKVQLPTRKLGRIKE